MTVRGRVQTGSDAQLQFVKAFTRLAATQAHADVLGSLLDGSIKLPASTSTSTCAGSS